jgi:hypothetical protein
MKIQGSRRNDMKTVFQNLLIVSLLTVLVACGTSTENLEANKIIGAEGGTLSSTDGAITLEIPAGTFASPTTVSVEPTTSSDAPWGEANGWRLIGLGIQMKAVAIKFKYSGELPIEWSSVALQDESKAWFGFGSTVVNKSEKTLSVTLPAQTLGNVAALSSRVQLRDTTEKKIYIYNDWVFKPLKAIVKVKKVLKMTLEVCLPKYSTDVSSLISINNVEKDCISTISSIIPVHQYVNEVEYGNSTIGAIVTVINPNDNGESFEYIAPSKVPSPNPVKISMIVTISKKIEKTFNSYITIEPSCFPSGNLIQSRVSKAASTCVDLWDGTITTTLHRTDNSSGFSYDSTLTSNVVFEFDDTAIRQPGFLKYRLKNGTYTYSLLANDTKYPCRTIASGSGSMPTVFVPTQTYYTAANLVLDTSFDPPKYLGGGISVVDITTTNNCNSEHIDKTETGPTFLLWWGMTGDFQTASTDGNTLQGSSETPDQLGNTVRSTWNLPEGQNNRISMTLHPNRYGWQTAIAQQYKSLTDTDSCNFSLI